MRMIDAETALAMVKPYEPSDEMVVVTMGTAIRLIHNAIDNAPTVDAVPVVRCRDCAAFEKKGEYPAGMLEYPDGMSYGYCYHWDYEQGMSPNQVDGNDFCSYGERREPDGKE